MKTSVRDAHAGSLGRICTARTVVKGGVKQIRRHLLAFLDDNVVGVPKVADEGVGDGVHWREALRVRIHGVGILRR